MEEGSASQVNGPGSLAAILKCQMDMGIPLSVDPLVFPTLCSLRVLIGPSLLLGIIMATGCLVTEAVDVRTERVPEGGLQPVVVENGGLVRLVYLTGDPKAADIHHVERKVGGGAWSPPRTVNSEPGAAVALGSVRGPRLALGGGGILHVLWNGSSKTRPTTSGSAPLLYTRSMPREGGFEVQRALGENTRHLDGGGAVAADGRGTVWVVWHAAQPTPPVGGDDETHRGVFLRVSRDEGLTFGPVRRIDPPGMGVCACCGLDAGIGPDGSGWVLVRGAAGRSERGMRLLTTRAGSLDFQSQTLDSWNLDQCPLSTCRLVQTPDSPSAVWISKGRVQWASLGAPDLRRTLSASARSANHPVLVSLGRTGSAIVAWTEGTGWQRGGDLAWCTLQAGTPNPTVQRLPGVPVWGAVAAWAESDSVVTLLY